MRTIYKYRLTLPYGRQQLVVGNNPRVLHVDFQAGQPTIWIEEDKPKTPADLRVTTTLVLHVIFTGDDVPEDGTYVGSILIEGGAFVLHVYSLGYV